MAPLWTSWALALLLGARHASEPDHLAAVSTLLAQRSGHARSAQLGAIWGLGHALSLLAVGGLLLLLHMRMSEQLASLFELVVAAMLLVLGVRSIQRALRAGRTGDAAAHRHGAERHHWHRGPSDHVHVGTWTMARGPLWVGLVHGLAGSGALTALTLANMPSLGPGLIYMLCFGLGSIAGMALVTSVAAWPLRRIAQRVQVQVALSTLAGMTSLVLGVLWGWPLVCKLSEL